MTVIPHSYTQVRDWVNRKEVADGVKISSAAHRQAVTLSREEAGVSHSFLTGISFVRKLSACGGWI